MRKGQWRRLPNSSQTEAFPTPFYLDKQTIARQFVFAFLPHRETMHWMDDRFMPQVTIP